MKKKMAVSLSFCFLLGLCYCRRSILSFVDDDDQRKKKDFFWKVFFRYGSFQKKNENIWIFSAVVVVKINVTHPPTLTQNNRFKTFKWFFSTLSSMEKTFEKNWWKKKSFWIFGFSIRKSTFNVHIDRKWPISWLLYESIKLVSSFSRRLTNLLVKHHSVNLDEFYFIFFPLYHNSSLWIFFLNTEIRCVNIPSLSNHIHTQRKNVYNTRHLWRLWWLWWNGSETHIHIIITQ